MGNGIRLIPNSIWLPAGWVARNAAGFIIPELEGPSAATVKNILEDIFMSLGVIASFEEASAEGILCSYTATSKGIASCKEMSPDR